MRIDLSFLPVVGATFLLIFARIGAMVMLLPGIGEAAIPARIRLVTALALSVLLFPMHRAAFTIDLRTFQPIVLILFQELFIGVVLGLTARVAISALQIAGNVIAQQLGLGFVTAVDPTQNQQGALLGNFLALLGITLLFATDLHHLLIVALHDSYTLFRPGEVPFSGDVAALLTRTLAAAFKIGVQLAAPFVLFGLLFNVGLGVLSRLMPQMQVFFIGMPLSILLGLAVLAVVIGAIMMSFLSYFEGVAVALAPSRGN